MQEYIAMWTNYFNFTGRTSRRGYWMAFLFNFIISLVIGLAAELIGIGWLTTIYTYAVMIPGISIAVRRLRDAGESWAWYFINVLPLVGQIVFIIMLCKPSVAPAQTENSQAYDF